MLLPQYENYYLGTLLNILVLCHVWFQVKLEDLGLDKELLEGNTDIELLIVQGDGKEVRATINTNVLQELTGLKPAATAREPSFMVAGKTGDGEEKGGEMGGGGVSDAEIKNLPPESLTGNPLRPYKCSMCPRTFKFYRTFRCHEVVHTKAVTYTCHMCKRVFARETNLASHLELHQKKAALGITEVKEKATKFEKKKEVRPSEEQSYKCSDCPQLFNDKRRLMFHRRKVHPRSFDMICPKCDRRFSNEGVFQRHASTHIGPFTCSECKAKFEDYDVHVKHWGDEHPEKCLKCSICGKVALSKQDLHGHVETRHEFESEENLKPMWDLIAFSCILCPRKFLKKIDFNEHMELDHMNDRPEVCFFCEKRFTKKSQLTAHIGNTHKMFEAYPCQQCDEEVLKKDLHIHGRVQHLPPYKCKVCSTEFETRNELEKHQADTYDMSFECKKCDFKSTYSYELKKHFAQHDGVTKSFLCDECGEAFEIKPQLKSHILASHFRNNHADMIRHHPELKLVNNACTCMICGEFNFEFKMQFVKHVRDVHYEGDLEAVYNAFPWIKINYPPPGDPVTCDTCGKNFLNMGYLRTHMRDTHKIEPPKPTPKANTEVTVTPKRRKRARKEEAVDDEEDEEVDTDFTNVEPRSSEKSYECKKCNQMFSRKASLTKHMNSIHNKKERLAELEAQEAEFEQDESVTEPVESPRKKVKLNFCQVCEEMFKSMDELIAHVKQVHEETNDAPSVDGETAEPKTHDISRKMCLLCSTASSEKTFYSPYGIRRHMRNVHDIEVSEAATPTAEKKDDKKNKSTLSSSNKKDTPKGKTRKSLKTEGDDASGLEVMDTEENDITNFLGKNFNLGKAVKGLIESENLNCKECKKSFKQADTLKKHKLIHMLEDNDDVQIENSEFEKSYLCKQCGNEYAVAITLIKHNRSKHGGENEEDILAYIDEVDELTKMIEQVRKEKKGKIKSRKRKASLPDTNSQQKKKAKVAEPETLTSPPQYSKTGRLITRSRKLVDQYSCLQCNKVFDIESSLKAHVRMVHESTKKGKPRIETDEDDSNGGKYECDVCQKTFSELSHLRTHLITIHDEDENLKIKDEALACEVCLQEFASEHSLSVHMRKHTGEKPYTCSVCDNGFISKFKLHLHLKKVHAKLWVKKVHCKLCLSLFDSEKEMEKHKKVHLKPDDDDDDEKSENQNKCTIKGCGKSFKWKKNLDSHKKFFHTEKGGSCEYCGKKFLKESMLKNHEVQCRRITGVEGLMTCDICKKNFSSKAKLMHHMLTHTSIKATVCSDCGETFKNEEGLHKHKCSKSKSKLKKKDSNVEEDAAKNTSNVAAKKETTSFSCNKCNLKFRQQYQLKVHRKKAHKIDFSEPSKVNTRPRRASSSSTSSAGTTAKSTKATPTASAKKTTKDKDTTKSTSKFKVQLGKSVKKSSSKDSKKKSSPPKANVELAKVLVCSMCSKTVKNRGALREHMRHMHKVPAEKLDEAVDSMETKRVRCLYCRECHQMFWNTTSYEEHVKQQHPDRAALELDKQVMAQMVKKEAMSPPLADAAEGPMDDVQYKCEFCTEVMWTQEAFDEHIAEFHAEHMKEYGVSESVKRKGKEPGAGEDFLNVEVYKNKSPDKLASQPVVRLEKIPSEDSEKESSVESGKDSESTGEKTGEDLDEIQRQAMEAETPSVDFYDFDANEEHDNSKASIEDQGNDNTETEEVDEDKPASENQANGESATTVSESQEESPDDQPKDADNIPDTEAVADEPTKDQTETNLEHAGEQEGETDNQKQDEEDKDLTVERGIEEVPQETEETEAATSEQVQDTEDLNTAMEVEESKFVESAPLLPAGLPIEADIVEQTFGVVSDDTIGNLITEGYEPME